MNLQERIQTLKTQLQITLVAHYYQRDEVVEVADVVGDSLALARRAVSAKTQNILFCGVKFMGESVKVLDGSKRVFMPKAAACAMADMITPEQFDAAIATMEGAGIPKEAIMPVAYINCSAAIKAKTGEMGGVICTSSNAETIISRALQSGKTIFFLPDRCLGENIARSMGITSALLGAPVMQQAQMVCYQGFCSVHQLFDPSDVLFFREKYPGIKVAVHPECRPEVVELADFTGSTSMIIQYIKGLGKEEQVVVGTEFNLVNRLKSIHPGVMVLSPTRPTCSTMSETTLEGVLETLEQLARGEMVEELFVEESIAHNAKLALDRMMEQSA